MKLDIIFHYEVNTQTGEITYIGKEEITVDTKTKSSTKAVKVEDNKEPLITLDSNKLVLTTGAVETLNVCADCRVDIKYKKKGNVTVPVIGTDESFGTKGGNRVSKTNTISFRGSANTKLAEFGTVFKLEPSEDNGIFYLVGDKNPTIDSSAINIEKEFDLTALEEFDLEDDSTDLDKFDFTF